MVNYNGTCNPQRQQREQDPLLFNDDYDTHHHSPIVDLEKRKQRRLCFALVTASILFAMVGVMAVWDAQQRARASEQNRVANAAAAARKQLNDAQQQHDRNSQHQSVSSGCEATLLLMRHCEKYGPYVTDEQGNEHCSYLGYERAKYLASLFGNNDDDDDNHDKGATSNPKLRYRWPTPSHLFALSPDRYDHWNFREWETLQPLSKQIGLFIEVLGRNDLPPLFFDLLQSGALCGRLVVVSWKHEYISELATALGCGPDEGCPPTYADTEFDQVWQLKYVYHAHRLQEKDDENILVVNNNTTIVHSISNKMNDDAYDKAQTEISAPLAGRAHTNDDDDDDDNPNGQKTVAGGKPGGNIRQRELQKMLHANQNFHSFHRLQQQQSRQLKKLGTSKHGWNVYAIVTNQNFDPLSFSTSVGDYPAGGTRHGGRWQDEI